MHKYRVALVCLALLALGLALRLPGLGSFLTPDEGDWTHNSAQFALALAQKDWAHTLTVPHPGVTTTWAGAAGLVLKWLLARPAGAAGFAGMAGSLMTGPIRTEFLPWMRLPVVVICVLGGIGVYLMARRLFGERTAFLGAALLAFDPFFLAHSRVLHTDALQATFLSLTWLALLVAVRTRGRQWYAFGGMAFAAAILTKSPSLALGPLVVGWIGWHAYRANAGRAGGSWWRSCAADLCWFGLPALLTIWVLWPALWVAPAGTLARVLGLMFTYAQGPHELGSYWLGRPVEVPGRAYYLAVLLWRTTAVTLTGLTVALGALAFGAIHALRTGSLGRRARAGLAPIRAGQGPELNTTPPKGMETALALILFAAWFGFFQSLGQKTADRYLLPVFPAVDLLAAWGWSAAGRALGGFALRAGQPRVVGLLGMKALARPAAALVLICGQAAALLAARPNYLTVYNPLAGGLRSAQATFLVGWGEGLETAAAYLNGLDPAGQGRTAAWYGQNVFGVFYRGRSYDLYYDTRTATDLYLNDVDYVVSYIGQEQRALLDPSITALLPAPIHTVSAGSVALARVYRWPKPFDHTTDRMLAPGLRLLGWDIRHPASSPGVASIALHWDAASLSGAPASSGPVRAWVKDVDGEVWAAAEAAPLAAPVEPAGVWPGQPTVAQTLALSLPAGLAAGSYRVEVASTGGPSEGLGAFSLGPSAQAGANPSGDPADRWLPAAVLFDGRLRLSAFNLATDGTGLALDLLWAPLAPATEDCQYFVHVVDAAGHIVAQADGPLGQLAGPDRSAWQAGDLVRRRVHLEVPASTPATGYAIYVGLYRLAGARLPVTVDGAATADGRYLLARSVQSPIK